MLLNKEPSPAAIYSLIHGQMVSPHEQDSGARTPFKSTKDAERVAAATALTVSPHLKKVERTPDSKGQQRDLTFTPLAHRGGSGLAPPRDLSLMLSPGVLASYMVSNTPLSVARSVERGSNQLATTSQSATAVDKEESSRKSGFKSARMLTYESEDPLLKKTRMESSCAVPLEISTPQQHQCQSATSNPSTLKSKKESVDYGRTLTPNHSLPSSRISSTHTSCEAEVKDSAPSSSFLSAVPENKAGEVMLVSPPVSGDLDQPTATATASVSRSSSSGVCLLTDLDPSIENESASMMAFALCTPTKDDPKDFLDAFS